MKYIVIHRFRDLQDSGKIYDVGEEYRGRKDKTRIAELLSDRNKIGTPVICKENKRMEVRAWLNRYFHS